MALFEIGFFCYHFANSHLVPQSYQSATKRYQSFGKMSYSIGLRNHTVQHTGGVFKSFHRCWIYVFSMRYSSRNIPLFIADLLDRFYRWTSDGKLFIYLSNWWPTESNLSNWLIDDFFFAWPKITGRCQSCRSIILL